MRYALYLFLIIAVSFISFEFISGKNIPYREFYSFIIEEEGPTGSLSVVVAVKNDKGRELIQKINAVIKKVRGTKEFLNTYLGPGWTPPEMVPLRKTRLNELLSGKYDHKSSL